MKGKEARDAVLEYIKTNQNINTKEKQLIDKKNPNFIISYEQ